MLIGKILDGVWRSPGSAGSWSELLLNAEIYPLSVRWKLVPETKGKRLEDIQAYFEARVKS